MPANLTAKQAIEKLKEIGYSHTLAEETVFITLGGDDVIATNAAGEEIYERSGKTVKEIEAVMEQTESERLIKETLGKSITIDADQVPEHELYTKRPEPLDEDRFKGSTGEGLIITKDEIILDDSSLDDPLSGPPPGKTAPDK